jgi:hypothetical protein
MTVKLPGSESLSGLPSGRSGRPIATIDTTAFGAGVVEQGEALWAASERQQIEQMQGLDAAMPGLGGGRRDPLDYPELRQ